MENIVNTIKDTFDTLTNTNTNTKEKEKSKDKESDTETKTEDNVKTKTKTKTTKKVSDNLTPKKEKPSRISKFTKKTNKKNQNKSISYEEALNIYLEEQHNYIYVRSKKKKKVDNLNLNLNLKKGKEKQCISCKRPVGTIFNYEGGIYSAMCGASSNNDPCSLDIRIKRSKIKNGYDRYIEKLEQLEIIKEDIIRLKLDFMFNFMSEVDMVNAFDILRNKLKATQKELVQIEQERNEKNYTSEIQMANKSLHESIQTIQNYMKEYHALNREQERNGVIRDLITEYVDNLLPKLRTLRKLEHVYTSQEMSNEGLPQTFLIKRDDIEFNELTNIYESKDEIMETKGEVLSFIY